MREDRRLTGNAGTEYRFMRKQKGMNNYCEETTVIT
jgi:hypothetical protein